MSIDNHSIILKDILKNKMLELNKSYDHFNVIEKKDLEIYFYKVLLGTNDSYYDKCLNIVKSLMVIEEENRQQQIQLNNQMHELYNQIKIQSDLSEQFCKDVEKIKKKNNECLKKLDDELNILEQKQKKNPFKCHDSSDFEYKSFKNNLLSLKTEIMKEFPSYKNLLLKKNKIENLCCDSYSEIRSIVIHLQNIITEINLDSIIDDQININKFTLNGKIFNTLEQAENYSDQIESSLEKYSKEIKNQKEIYNTYTRNKRKKYDEEIIEPIKKIKMKKQKLFQEYNKKFNELSNR